MEDAQDLYKDMFKEPSDQELEALLEKKAPCVPQQDLGDMGKKTIFPMSLDEFYESFFNLKAPMNFLKYYQLNKDFRDI